MTFPHNTLLTVVPRMARGFAFVWVLTAPISSSSALNTPQRPAVITTAQSSAEYIPGSGSSHSSGSHTYLAMIGPAALRFAEAPPQLPPEPVRPTPPSSTQPKQAASETEVTRSASAAVHASDLVDKPATANSESPEVEGPPLNSSKPVSILPDDTRREIRAEDVLPFFQFPSASDSGDAATPLTTSQPQRSTAPPSSATYRQQ